MLFRRFSAFAALLAALLLSSCLDYEEELTIHQDLSGEIQAKISLPDTLVTKYAAVGQEFSLDNINKRLKPLSGISLLAYENTGGRKPVVTIKLGFSSISALNQAIAANPPAGVLAGIFTVKPESGRTTIERKLGEGGSLAGLPEFNYANYKIHFDGTIAATNSGFYNNHGQDVRYRYKLTELIIQKPVLSTSLSGNIPWLWISIGALVVILASWFGWKALNRKPARKYANSPSTPPVHRGHAAKAVPVTVADPEPEPEPAPKANPKQAPGPASRPQAKPGQRPGATSPPAAKPASSAPPAANNPPQSPSQPGSFPVPQRPTPSTPPRPGPKPPQRKPPGA